MADILMRKLWYIILHKLSWVKEHDNFMDRIEKTIEESDLERESIAIRINWLELLIQKGFDSKKD